MSDPKYMKEWGPLTQEEFAALTPYQRGYATYMLGARDDQPNVPDEANPYKKGSRESDEWERGQNAAYISVLDMEE